MSASKSPQPLPDRANLHQLRKRAKELHATGRFSTLASAQHALARRHGFESWPTLKLAVESQTLRRLIQERDVTGATHLLRASRKVASHAFPDGSTPLHEAAECNCAEIISELVAAGAQFDKTYASSGHTALSWAITVGSMNAALKLVELGNEPDPALVHSRGGSGTLLDTAAYNGQVESVRILLEYGADTTVRNAAGLTPSQTAAARGHGELARLLA